MSSNPAAHTKLCWDEAMTWKDVTHIKDSVAAYTGLQCGMVIEENYEHIAATLRRVVVEDADLTDFPSPDLFSSQLWNCLILALKLTPDSDSEALPLGDDSLTPPRQKKVWELLSGFQREQANLKQRQRQSRRTENAKRARIDEEARLREQQCEMAVQAEKDEWVSQREEELKCAEAREEELRGKLSALSKELAKETMRKEMCRELLDKEGVERPRRKCAQPREREEQPPITAADARGHHTWENTRVGRRRSNVAGYGLFSKVAVKEGQQVFAALLPDEQAEDAFAEKEYSCYSHILHADGKSALAIDPGRNMRGNVWACEADNDIRLLRLLNHSKTPNVKLDVDEAATPFWFEGVGGVKYGPWYTCSIEALEDIEEGVELMIKYADAPAEWDE